MPETLEQVTAQLAQAVEAQKTLVTERDALKQEVATLTAQVTTLTEEKTGLEGRITTLEQETGKRIMAHRIQVLEMAGSKPPDDEPEDAKKKRQEAIASMNDDAFSLFVGATRDSGGQSSQTGSGGFSPDPGKGEKKLTL